MPWPPLLFVKGECDGHPNALENSEAMLKIRFSRWKPDELVPVYIGPFQGEVVLAFGTRKHEEQMKMAPGSDVVCDEQAAAFANAKSLRDVLSREDENTCGIRDVRWVTEREFSEWREAARRSQKKTWARDLVGVGKWGDKMCVRWVDLREQESGAHVRSAWVGPVRAGAQDRAG